MTPTTHWIIYFSCVISLHFHLLLISSVVMCYGWHNWHDHLAWWPPPAMRAKISNSNYTITVDLRPVPLKPGCQTHDSVSTCTRKHDMMQTLGSAGARRNVGWRVPGQELIMSSGLTTRGESRVCDYVGKFHQLRLGHIKPGSSREDLGLKLAAVSSPHNPALTHHYCQW